MPGKSLFDGVEDYWAGSEERTVVGMEPFRIDSILSDCRCKPPKIFRDVMGNVCMARRLSRDYDRWSIRLFCPGGCGEIIGIGIAGRYLIKS
ncbi:MAG: hypothetical protein CEN89_520 [Candidatus Berkelbacteria bacterium Licking1014_7]|uniref:Uncharacterized protein n=1 Tax=Candidatus Berkelbacteria bacterium Licking1014_7 TaxID=2017147 RepID=A0A554LIQ2_9BACT|nr:MAG: hypothetical protein CEN89_520 [Candidatus Berkelbacteria bacterium Licking1014_7]